MEAQGLADPENRSSFFVNPPSYNNPSVGNAPGAAAAALKLPHTNTTSYQHHHHHNSTNQTLHPAPPSRTTVRAKPGSIIHAAPIAHDAGSQSNAESNTASDSTDIKNVIQHIEPTHEQQQEQQDKSSGKPLLLTPPVPTPRPALFPISAFVRR